MSDTPKRPNLIIFNPDQWRGDVLGCHGNPAAVTPNLDRLAATDGVSFRNAFCQNPVCTPSRCSFMSGWYPHVRGHKSMGHMLRPPHDNNLLKALKDDGYFVWWGGKNDLVPAQDGFEDYCDVRYSSHYAWVRDPTIEPPDPLYGPHRPIEDFDDPADFYSFYRGILEPSVGREYYRDCDWATVEGAVHFIKNYKWEHPWCVFIAIAYPHPPYCVEQRYYDLIEPENLPPRRPGPQAWQGPKPAFMQAYRERVGIGEWPEERWDELRRVYYAQCARVDHQVGLVLDALQEAGVYDDTAMFMFADHGDWTGDYDLVEKHQICYDDCLVNVPLVVKPPKAVGVRPGVRDSLVELIDFPATVEAWTGISLPQAHFGKDLTPVITGDRDEHRDVVFCEGGQLDAEVGFARAESGGKAPNPKGLYWGKQSVQEEAIEHIGRSFMLRTPTHKYIRRVYEADELYDLENDPMELHNRIGDAASDPELKEVLMRLERRLLRWLTETSDITPVGNDRRE